MPNIDDTPQADNYADTTDYHDSTKPHVRIRDGHDNSTDREAILNHQDDTYFMAEVDVPETLDVSFKILTLI